MKISYADMLPLIPDKEDGVITARVISKVMGCAESYVRKLINQARSNGVPICSTTAGYYFSDDYADITSTIKFLTHRVNTQMQAINGLKNITEEG